MLSKSARETRFFSAIAEASAMASTDAVIEVARQFHDVGRAHFLAEVEDALTDSVEIGFTASFEAAARRCRSTASSPPRLRDVRRPELSQAPAVLRVTFRQSSRRDRRDGADRDMYARAERLAESIARYSEQCAIVGDD